MNLFDQLLHNIELIKLRTTLMNYRCLLIVLLALTTAGNNVMAEEEPAGLEVLTPDQLENFQFEDAPKKEPAVITELNVGQRYILSSQRRSIEDLITQRLGILTLKQDKTDLEIIQKVVDRRILNDRDVREWQALGVLFGDILANEMDLHWVSYEDDLGTSKALRWKDTDNFVFPLTVFSKRVQFNEKIDARAIYNKIETSVENFKRIESLRPG